MGSDCMFQASFTEPGTSQKNAIPLVMGLAYFKSALWQRTALPGLPEDLNLDLSGSEAGSTLTLFCFTLVTMLVLCTW